MALEHTKQTAYVGIEKQQPPASSWNQAVNVLFRTRQGLRRGKAPRRQYPPTQTNTRAGHSSHHIEFGRAQQRVGHLNRRVLGGTVDALER